MTATLYTSRHVVSSLGHWDVAAVHEHPADSELDALLEEQRVIVQHLGDLLDLPAK